MILSFVSLVKTSLLLELAKKKFIGYFYYLAKSTKMGGFFEKIFLLVRAVLEYIYSRPAMLLEFEFDSQPEGRQSISDFNVYCITFEGREYTILEAINEVKSTIGDYLLLIQENKGEKQLTSIPYGNEMWRTIARVLHLFVEILLYISL